MSDNSKLKLDEGQMNERVDALKNAIEDFRTVGHSPFDEEIGYLESMNTDFTAKLRTMLENLNDDSIAFLGDLEELEERAEEIAENLKKVDTDNAKSMKKMKEN